MKKQYLTYLVTSKIGGESNAPEWVLLFKAGWGEVEGVGKFLVDREAFDLLTAHISKRGNEIVFDYEHQTLKDVKAPAAGWNKTYRWIDSVGIEARVDWTDEAAEYIAKKEYRYFSPVFFVRQRDKRVCGLHSVALTNAPKTNNLTPLLAKLGAGYQPGQEDNMDELLKALIAKLGLADDADEKAILAALGGLDEKKVAAKEVIPADVLAALELESGDASVVVASIHALKQNTKGMVSRADFDTLVAKLNGKNAAEAVDAALVAGKITPDQKEWAENYATRDPEGFAVFVSKASVVVPMDKLPGGNELVTAKLVAGVTVRVAEMFGNTAEDIKKYA